jgi:predicted DNA-binding transcriptional regulator YafY
MKRTERLFALAEALRARRTGVTAEALAARFGVSVRTIYRDLDGLRAASLPLVAERGRGGGYALDRAYALPPVNFDAREAAVLLAAGRLLAELRLLPFTATLASALDKVRAALPSQRQREVDALGGTLAFVGVPARTASPEVRRAVEEAWFDKRPLRLRYDGAYGPTERTVRVDGLVMERTETLLNCFDLDKGEARQLRLHQIAWARPADAGAAGAEPPPRRTVGRAFKPRRR